MSSILLIPPSSPVVVVISNPWQCNPSVGAVWQQSRLKKRFLCSSEASPLTCGSKFAIRSETMYSTATKEPVWRGGGARHRGRRLFAYRVTTVGGVEVEGGVSFGWGQCPLRLRPLDVHLLRRTDGLDGTAGFDSHQAARKSDQKEVLPRNSCR